MFTLSCIVIVDCLVYGVVEFADLSIILYFFAVSIDLLFYVQVAVQKLL